MTKPQLNVTCEHCGYKWHTKAKTLFITCPSCLGKTKNPKYTSIIEDVLNVDSNFWKIMKKQEED